MNSFNKNKQIVNICKNYYKIVNTDFSENDKEAYAIIKLYSDYIFSAELISQREVEKLTKVDDIMYKFATDSRFKKEMLAKLSTLRVNAGVTDIREYVMNKLIEYFEDYKDTITRNIYLPRWI